MNLNKATVEEEGGDKVGLKYSIKKSNAVTVQDYNTPV